MGNTAYACDESNSQTKTKSSRTRKEEDDNDKGKDNNAKEEIELLQDDWNYLDIQLFRILPK